MVHGLLTIPSEICFVIASFVEVKDVISLRRTCKYLHNITKDKSLWLSLLQFQHASLPLPHFAREGIASDTAANMGQAIVEATVASVYRTYTTWLIPRTRPWAELVRLNTPSALTSDLIREAWEPRTILALDIFLDRWLVAVFQDAVELWDILPESELRPAKAAVSWLASETKARCCALEHVDNQTFFWCTSTLNSEQDAIFVVVASNQATYILRFPIFVGPPSPGHQSAIVYTMHTDAARAVRAFDPSSKIIAFGRSQIISLVNMDTRIRWDIGVGEEGEDLWSGVIGLRFLTSRHILCIKTRSVQLYTFSGSFKRSTFSPYPTNEAPADKQATAANINVQQHDFPQTTFRGVSICDPRIVKVSDDTTTISCDFLAYDVLRGLFHYRVNVRFPPLFALQEHTLSDTQCEDVAVPFSMDTSLVSAHHMAQSIPVGSDQAGIPPRRGGFTLGSRGFVSSCALGPQGRRGIWVERQRNSVRRAVFGFDISPNVDDEDAPIRGKCIYEVNSFNLMDDVTHCAFSEVTGKVVLGTRNGELLLV